MTSRAQIAKLTKADPALRIPYLGEERALGELQALGVTLSAEDYKLVRQALGGGKRGRARARDLVPLQCPHCGCRLSLIDRSGREPYFAPTDEEDATSHGPACEAPAAEREVTPATQSEVAPAAKREVAPAADAEVAPAAQREVAPAAPREVALAAQLEVAPAAQLEVAPAAAADEITPSEDESALPGAHYVIDDASAQRDGRQLLTQALHRAVPPNSVVQFRSQSYAITAAADVHTLRDGQLVAIYGRITELEWNEDFGRLILRATPRTVQVWATASVPRRLLQLDQNPHDATPTLSKPAPFLVFGTLRKLNAVCGVPVVHSEMFVLLQPLALSFREKRDRIVSIDGMALLPTAIERAQPFADAPSSEHSGVSDVASAADITAASDMSETDHVTPEPDFASPDESETDDLTVIDGAVVAADNALVDPGADDRTIDVTEMFAALEEVVTGPAPATHSEVVELPRAAASDSESGRSRGKGKRRKRQRTTSRSLAAGVGRSRSDS